MTIQTKMQDEASDFTKKTGIPLNVDVVEQVPIRKITVDSIDEETGSAKFSVKTVMETQTVRYLHSPKVRVRCNTGEHIFRPLDIKKGIFGCTKCPFAARIHPANYIFKDGQLIHRDTKRVV